ncbi:hypothetical protein [Lysinibacillus xylanilyticus]|uniref:hypothetical protein n=1 Tax=Lysinibacillus xylanilyticus TaxID=582475 RepID=UPI003D012A41
MACILWHITRKKRISVINICSKTNGQQHYLSAQKRSANEAVGVTKVKKASRLERKILLI